MSLATIQGKLSRMEMKNIKGGDEEEDPNGAVKKCGDGCVPYNSGCPTNCECAQKVGSGNIYNCGGH